MRKILITGGCGFVGLNLTFELICSSEFDVRILDNLSVGTIRSLEKVLKEFGKYTKKEITPTQYSYTLGNNKRTEVEIFIGDITDQTQCDKSLTGIFAAVHLAGQTGVLPSIENPLHDCNVNINGTLNLLLSSVKNNLEAFIFASSAAPLGEQEAPNSEKKLPKPLSPYGASKLACEGYCSAFFGSYGLNTCAVRFSNVYGPRSSHKTSVIAKFFNQVISKEPLVIYGDGNQTRDFVHVSDLSRGIILAIKTLTAGDNIKQKELAGSVVHLATGIETSVNELVHAIKDIVKSDKGYLIDIEHKPARKGEIIRNYSDISKARKVLGYEPKINFHNGLVSTWNSFTRNSLNTIYL